jgi:hypothetical protein
MDGVEIILTIICSIQFILFASILYYVIKCKNANNVRMSDTGLQYDAEIVARSGSRGRYINTRGINRNGGGLTQPLGGNNNSSL